MQRSTHQKVKNEKVMTMRKKISGGVHFVVNKETKAKANRFSLLKRALQMNHRKQRTNPNFCRHG